MGGIVGLYNADGAPVDRDALRRGTDRMSHWGSGAPSLWTRGPVGLGHLAFPTTPEALFESLPLEDPTGRFVLTADARIDNRAELWGSLSLRRPLGGTTDADLILAAYERWGEESPQHLVGAFSFLVWDAREGALFGARDRVGLRPFYYSEVGGALRVASSLPALLATGVGRAVNPERIADHLVGIISNSSYTFYRDALRLPPGHTLTARSGGVRVSSYWALDPEREAEPAGDDEYGAAFAELFAEAVRCRLRAPGPVASFLSGGLDSSAVSVVAQRIESDRGRPPLVTFSKVYGRVPESDERPYMDAVLAGGRYDPQFVEADRTVLPLSSIPPLVDVYGSPFAVPAASTSAELHPAIRDAGVRVVLDGHGGDEVVSKGRGLIPELVAGGHWGHLLRELRAASSGEVPRGWARLYVSFLLQSADERLRLVAGAGPARRALRRAQRLVYPPPAPTPFRDDLHWLDASFAEAVSVEGRVRSARSSGRSSVLTARSLDHRLLTHPVQPEALEFLHVTSSAEGYERRYPFWDHRLVEFCLSLPAHVKRRRGLGRYVLRHGLRRELPAVVRERRTKAEFQAVIERGVLTQDREAYASALETLPSDLAEYVEPVALRRILAERGGAGGVEDKLAFLLRLSALGAWLHVR